MAGNATSTASKTGSLLLVTNSVAYNVISVSEYLGRMPALFLYLFFALLSPGKGPISATTSSFPAV